MGALLVLGYAALVVYAYWPTGIEEVSAKNLAGRDDRFIEANGLQLRYRVYGVPGPDRPNLVLVVVDGPLREYEHQLLAQLGEMEKRVLVCLNKTDWYEDGDFLGLHDDVSH